MSSRSRPKPCPFSIRFRRGGCAGGVVVGWIAIPNPLETGKAPSFGEDFIGSDRDFKNLGSRSRCPLTKYPTKKPCLKLGRILQDPFGGFRQFRHDYLNFSVAPGTTH